MKIAEGETGTLLKKVYKGSRSDLFKRIARCAARERKEFVITANPETFMTALMCPKLSDVIKREDVLVVPDGFGLVFALRVAGLGRCKKIPGVELASALLELSHRRGLRIYLYGGSDATIAGMKRTLKEKYPGAALVGAANGYDSDPDEIMEQILAAAPDIIMVALGVPAQEILIERYFDRFEKGIFIGVGGSFDVLSGRKRRAPKLLCSMNLEWLYRIVTEPVRIKRFFGYTLRFIGMVILRIR